MSLIAKIQQRSLLQNKLQAQLAQMSYQALNGTRQSVRNFREGTLEIGKMYFTPPQDRITKEMIMDYQKSEQEKHYTDPLSNDKLLYEPTGLSDLIIPYKEIINGPITGAASTEEDVQKYHADFMQLHYDLDALKEKKENKNQEYKNKIVEHNKKVTELNATRAELKIVQQNFINLKKELKETNDKIVAHNASLPSGVTPSNKFTKKLDYLDTKEKRLQNDVKDADLLYNTTIPDKIAVIRTELAPLATDYPILQAERDAMTVDIKNKENDILAKEQEIGQIKKNIIHFFDTESRQNYLSVKISTK